MTTLSRVSYGASFNTLTIYDSFIRKESKNHYGLTKIKKEIAFYKHLAEHRIDFPRPEIIEYFENGYDMKYMTGYVPLYLVFPTLAPNDQVSLLQSIKARLESLHAVQRQIDKATLQECLVIEFRKKIYDRFAEVKSILEPFHYITHVNGVRLLSFEFVVEFLYAKISAYFESNTQSVSLIHGDCQFNNILYHEKDFVFIDPRGYWGTLQDGYGLPQYDYAKICFALTGYDAFDNMDVKSLNIEGSNLILPNLFLVENPFSDEIITLMMLSIWLGNAHCFKENPQKAAFSYFYALYLASTFYHNSESNTHPHE